MPLGTLIISAVASVGLRLLSSALQKEDSVDFNESIPDSSYRQPVGKIYNKYRLNTNIIEPFGEEQAFRKKGSGKDKRLLGTFHAIVSQSHADIDLYWLNGRAFPPSPNIDWMDGSYEQKGWLHRGSYDESKLKFANNPYYDALKAETGVSYDTFSSVGYRGICSIGFVTENLTQFNINTFPRISVLHHTKHEYTLPEIIADICQDAGIEPEQIDAQELAADEVIGFNRPQNGQSYAQEIAPLGVVYKFFVTETTEGILSFRKFERSGASFTIPWQDFIPNESGQLWSETEEDPRDLPKTISFDFSDRAIGFTKNTVVSDEYLSAVGQGQENIEVPVVLAEETAKEIANWQLNQTWVRQKSYSYKLGLKYVGEFEVGDVLVLPDGSATQVERFTVGADYTISVSAVRYDDKTNSTTAYVGNSAVGTSSNTNIDDTPTGDTGFNVDGTVNYGTLKLLDLPLADPTHSELGFYCMSDRANSSLYLNYGEGDLEELEFVEASTFGVCDTILPAVENYNLQSLNLPIVDRGNVLEISLTSGSLVEAITDLDFDRSKRIAFIGKQVNNVWVGEYICFQFAEDLGGGRYELEQLQRGLRGTEGYISQHTVGEEFFLLAGEQAYWERVIFDPTQIGEVIVGKLGVAANQDLAITPAVTLTIAGQSLLPFAPTDVAVVEDPEGNLVFSFKDRDRGRNLGEEQDNYELDLLDGNVVVRTLSGKNPIIYPQAQKTVDGLDLSAIDLNIYKISSLVDRGLVGLVRDLAVDGVSNTLVTGTDVNNKGFKYISANYTITPEDSGYWLLVDTTAGDIDIALGEVDSTEVWLQNIGINRCYMLGNFRAVRDSLIQNEAIYLVSKGSFWHGLISGNIDIPHHLIVNANLTLNQTHHNKIISVQSSTLVTITLDEDAIVNPKDFHTTIRKKGEGDVFFQVANNPGSVLESVGTTLATKYRAAYVGYEGNGVWIALGDLQ